MSLLKNSTIVVAGVIISNILAYAFHFIAGRILGPEDYGVFGSLMALFMQIAMPASALSYTVSKFTSRYLAEQKPGMISLMRRKVRNNVLVFSAILLLIIILISKSLATYLKINSVIPIITVGVITMFSFLLPINRGVIQGTRKFVILSWNTVAEAVIRMLLLLVFLEIGWGVNGAVLSYGLAYFVAYSLLFPYLRNYKKDVEGTQKLSLKPVYMFAAQVLVVSIVVQSIINIPSLIIKHYYSDEFTGCWTAALNIARISLFIVSAISVVMFPEVAGEKINYKQRKIFGRALVLASFTSAAISVVFFAIPEILIQTLYGERFLGAVPILQWMGVAMIGVGLMQICADYFLARLK